MFMRLYCALFTFSRRATPDARERIPTAPLLLHTGKCPFQQLEVAGITQFTHVSYQSSVSRKNSWWGDRFRGKRQIGRERAHQPADTPQSRRLDRDEPRPPECRPTFFLLLV